MIWVVRDIVNFLIFPFIWLAIYGARQNIAGFSKADIVTYYLIVAFISIVVTSHIGEVIKKDIIRGELSATLVRPINYLFFHLFHELAYRVYGFLIGIVMVGLFIIFLPHLVIVPHAPLTFLLFGLALICAFIISQTTQTMIGITAFWLGENKFMNDTITLLQLLFGGEIAPLNFFSPTFQLIATFLPFKYLVFFPAQIYLGQLSQGESLKNFMIIFAWIIGLITALLLLWRRGIKLYDGSGI